MSSFEVDYTQVAGAATKVQATSAAIETETAAMTTHLTEMRASWRGTASAAFEGAYTEWLSAQAAVRTALTSIATALSSAANTYEEAEASARGLFSR